MGQQPGNEDDRQDEVHVPGIEGAVPPSVAGDVDDAVTPKVGGRLTPWVPPGQGDESDEQPAERPTDA